MPWNCSVLITFRHSGFHLRDLVRQKRYIQTSTTRRWRRRYTHTEMTAVNNQLTRRTTTATIAPKIDRSADDRAEKRKQALTRLSSIAMHVCTYLYFAFCFSSGSSEVSPVLFLPSRPPRGPVFREGSLPLPFRHPPGVEN